MNKGKIIAIEGTACSGKTTQSKELFKELDNTVYMKMLPSNTNRGQHIREVCSGLTPLEVDLLYLEDLYACQS